MVPMESLDTFSSVLPSTLSSIHVSGLSVTRKPRLSAIRASVGAKSHHRLVTASDYKASRDILSFFILLPEAIVHIDAEEFSQVIGLVIQSADDGVCLSEIKLQKQHLSVA